MSLNSIFSNTASPLDRRPIIRRRGRPGRVTWEIDDGWVDVTCTPIIGVIISMLLSGSNLGHENK